MQQASLPVDMLNFYQKITKIIKNSPLAKAGPENFFSNQKEIFNILIKS